MNIIVENACYSYKKVTSDLSEHFIFGEGGGNSCNVHDYRNNTLIISYKIMQTLCQLTIIL